ncbi:MAG: tRNA (N6-isopentenyl adenosine(37)-C2)-methylthiotransferase MiaB [Candidatus Aminicenantes bacterium RBG_16_63_16]|nr:MAG: tRNA (N6-isopentenyl adenosine(37)-C2)-methylthiotransferase MiaB [Candidatus Aminicenantes bacterium RBG_16_63_16]
MIRFFIRTFGCQMNESDSERVAGILSRAGGSPAARVEEADLVIVNTCAVREKSEDKLFSYLGRLARLKERKPLRLGVVGCVAQLRSLELLGRRSPVDFVLGPDNYAQLAEILRTASAEKIAATDWSADWHETPPDLILRESPVSGYVTVMEGCDNFCAYCVVPFTRGREKYRPLFSILAEAADLVRRGYKEVQLLGQNVNSYRDPESGRTFAGLLSEVTAIDDLPWVRFLTSHPKDFPDEIGRVMSERRNICRQLHLPLQSGSSAVLKRMRRGYTREKYLDIVAGLRRLMPEIALSTDIIVGYPGETDKDFEATLDLLKTVRFTGIFSFRYSPRPLTRAADLADDIPKAEKQRRLAAVQALQKDIQLEANARRVGQAQKVLCLGRSQKTPQLFSGRNEGNQVVNFSSTGDGVGKFVTVRITGSGPYGLRGEETSP